MTADWQISYLNNDGGYVIRTFSQSVCHHHHHQIAETAEVRCVNPKWPLGRALDHSARMLKGVPSPICWIHEFSTGRRHQPGPKREPRLLLLRPVIMHGELACGHRVSPHGRTIHYMAETHYHCPLPLPHR